MKAHTFEARRTHRLDYLLYLPENTAEPVPLLLYLHGGGESGQDLNLLKTCGLPKLLEQGQTFLPSLLPKTQILTSSFPMRRSSRC